MQTSKTYFEQIPVETVKKIANVDVPSEETKTEETKTKEVPAGGKTIDGKTDGKTINSNWRTLAEKVQGETDPAKMIGLVQNLIAKLDEEGIEKGRPRQVDLK
jgi:hypothetical protein